jgi:sugar lactone lactonase YvrE
MTAGTGAGGAAGGAARSTPVARRGSARRGLLTEGPRWDGGRAELLWVDILAGEVHTAAVGDDGRLEPVRGVRVGRHVGAAAPAAAGGYVIAAASGFWHADDDGRLRELAQPEAGHTDVRMNDGICDPQGRFWAGTMAYAETPGAGRLYRLELDGSCTLVLDGLTISNGMGWSPDGTTMYLADSGVGDVYAFDFDPSRGTLDRRRTFAHVSVPGAAPDGLTVDSDGDVWVALWNGAAVARYGPDGSLRETLPVPVDRPTSCAFGGRDGATLFVTTSREDLEPTALARQPQAGHVLCIDGLGVTGPPCMPYRGPVIAP